MIAGPALAETCPPAPALGAQQGAILTELARTGSAAAAAPLTARLWALWTQAPDPVAQGLLDRGMALIAQGNPAAAEPVLAALVAYCPAYAEGYNQRAYAVFLQGDYAAALADLEAALALNPQHVAALSGKALALIGLGEAAAAQAALRAALALNPWLQERAFLTAPLGVDL